MNKEDSLQFVEERLRHHHRGPLTRDFGFQRPPRVTRRYAIELDKDGASVFERVDDSVHVTCTSGRLWITHDGDCKDVILGAGETYQAQRDTAMHLFALQDCVLEIQFDDDWVEH